MMQASVQHKKRINVVILTAYMSWLVFSHLFLNDYLNNREVIIFTLICMVVIFFLSAKLITYLEHIEINNIREKSNLKERLMVFLLVTSLCFIILLIWFLAYNPGGFSPDTLSQYSQAISGTYQDWHPTWHTLLFYTIPLKITGNFSSIVFFQIVYFSLTIGYMVMTIYKYTNKLFAIVSASYIILNPYTGNLVMYPLKDVAFAMMGCIAMTMTMEMLFEKDAREKWWRIVLLGVVIVNTTIFRRNAILFTAILIVGLFFVLSKKQFLQLIISILLMAVIVKGPVYRILNVEKVEGTPLIEAVGVPLTIITNVAVEAPEKLDDETAEFVNALAPKEVYDTFYLEGGFNTIKWNSDINLDVIPEAGLGKILKMTCNCIKRAPNESLKAFIQLTDMVYKVDGGVDGDRDVGICDENSEIKYKGNMSLAEWVYGYKVAIDKSMLVHLRYVGTAILMMLIAILAKTDFFKKEDYIKLIICIAILVYDGGTMLLLTGRDLEYFFISHLICPIVIAIMFIKKEPDSE